MAKAKGSPTVYQARLKVFGKYFEGKGKTVSDAIASLKPGNVKGTAVLTITHGTFSKDRIIPGPMTYRLFNSAGLTREVQLKNVSLMFDGI